MRKLHKYPVSNQEPQSKFAVYVKKRLNGFYNFDKICSSLGILVNVNKIKLKLKIK